MYTSFGKGNTEIGKLGNLCCRLSSLSTFHSMVDMFGKLCPPIRYFHTICLSIRHLSRLQYSHISIIPCLWARYILHRLRHMVFNPLLPDQAMILKHKLISPRRHHTADVHYIHTFCCRRRYNPPRSPISHLSFNLNSRSRLRGSQSLFHRHYTVPQLKHMLHQLLSRLVFRLEAFHLY